MAGFDPEPVQSSLSCPRVGLSASRALGLQATESLVPTGAEAVDGGRDVSEHFLDRLFAVDVDEQSASGVEAEERLRLCVEYLETVCYAKLGVIDTTFPLGPSQESVAQLVAADREMDNSLEFNSRDFLGYSVRFFGLAQRPREAIKYVPAVGSCLEYRRGQDLEHQPVRYEIAPLQVVSCDPPDLGAVRHLSTQ